MARHSGRRSETQTTARWLTLRWDQLEAWAGAESVSRGKTYHRQQRVRDFAVTSDGRLLATVRGTKRYTVTVALSDGRASAPALRSTCTCPVGADGCKHAVAAVCHFLDLLDRETTIPSADDDPRWAKLGVRDTRPDAQKAHAAAKTADAKLLRQLQSYDRAPLEQLVLSLAGRFPEVREALAEQFAMEKRDVKRLLAEARRELRALRDAFDDDDADDWYGYGEPAGGADFGPLRLRLERMSSKGFGDAVAELAREVLHVGRELVGQSYDEGETADDLHRCLLVVFDAVAQSTWAPARKLRFAVEATLTDPYDVIGDAADAVLALPFAAADWSLLADRLIGTLGLIPAKGRPRRTGRDDAGESLLPDLLGDGTRDDALSQLTRALENAGRSDEVLAILEREADANGSYVRLVTHLVGQQRFDDARRCAAAGIERTARDRPEVARALVDRLRDVAERTGQWDVVAAHAAHAFFESPSAHGFDALLKAARKAHRADPVRRIAQAFLETGAEPNWPLPCPDYFGQLARSPLHPRRETMGTHYGVLIDLAIAHDDPAGALRWHDAFLAGAANSKPDLAWDSPDAYADRVAEAVSASHPHRALDIYRRRIEQHLRHASAREYELVANYLRKVRPILVSIGCESDWDHLLSDVRTRFKNRPRLMETLDRLDARPTAAQR